MELRPICPKCGCKDFDFDYVTCNETFDERGQIYECRCEECDHVWYVEAIYKIAELYNLSNTFTGRELDEYIEGYH